METEKKVYQYRKEDFIPIKGMMAHHNRCVNETHKDDSLMFDDGYLSQCWIRDCGLSIYNIALFVPPLVGIAKLLLD